MKSLMNNGIEVIFVKVDSHTGDLYNEIADEKCKEALNITSNNEVYKYLGNNKIYVSNNLVKEELKFIVRDRDYNIININNEENINNDHIKKCEVALDNNINESDEIINKLKLLLKAIPIEKQRDVLSYAEYLYNKEK